MKTKSCAGIVAVGITCLIFAAASIAQTSNPSAKEASTTMHASGPFDVKITPAEDKSAEGKSEDPLLGRLVLDKHYHGDLEATAQGQMLTAGTTVKGSGAYVAIEKVTGTLHGRSGSFVLQHTGTMTQGAPLLTINVVPDSGTGQMAGITGKMTINIAEGKHSYDFEYTLPSVQ